MKRKKWSEQEEQTLLNKYSSLLTSGTLSKLKTREKKFKPIAEHVNSTHHLQDSTTFPFVWSWRDVSIKVQNMRHQYLGVKQKIRLSKHHFSWKDGENHWVNFLMYKDIFGDVEDFRSKQLTMDCEDGLGLGFADDDDAIGNDLEQDGGFGNVGFVRRKKLKMGFGVGRLGLLGSQVLESRDVIVRREEKRRECKFNRENCESEREDANREAETRKEECEIEREEALEKREIELEERQTEWARKENEKRLRVQREFDKEHHWKMKMEEKKEEEEMEWRERMIRLQMEHEKAMIQMQADASQNQMQLVGVMARFMCHFFGLVNDGLVGGLGNSPPQILPNLQLPGGLDDNGKPGDNSPSEFI